MSQIRENVEEDDGEVTGCKIKRCFTFLKIMNWLPICELKLQALCPVKFLNLDIGM